MRVLHVGPGRVKVFDEVDVVAPDLAVHPAVKLLGLQEYAEAAGLLQLGLALVDQVRVVLHVLGRLVPQVEDRAPLVLRLRRLGHVGGRLAEELAVRRLVVARDDLLHSLRPGRVPSSHADGQRPAHRADEAIDGREVLAGPLQHVHDVVAPQHGLEAAAHEHRVLVRREHRRGPIGSLEDALEHLGRLVASLQQLRPGEAGEDVLHQQHVGVPAAVQGPRVLGVVDEVGRPALVLVGRVDLALVDWAGRKDLPLGARLQELAQVLQRHLDAPPLQHRVEPIDARPVQLQPDLVNLIPGLLLHLY